MERAGKGITSMLWNKPKWSDSPGCFERHLQRRKDNPLFPQARQVITKSEFAEAQARDRRDRDALFGAITNLGAEMSVPNASIAAAGSFLQKVQHLLERAAAVGGEIQDAVGALESAEASLTQRLNQALPDGAGLLDRAASLASIERIPFFAQHKREDSPIPPEEEVPALLSEDPETISFFGHLSRTFPGFKPFEADVRAHLEISVGRGLHPDRAAELLLAWSRPQDHEAPNQAL